MYSTSKWIHYIATGNHKLELMQMDTYITQMLKKINIFCISLLKIFPKNISLSLIKFKVTESTSFWFPFLQLLKILPLFLDSLRCAFRLSSGFLISILCPYWSMSRLPSSVCHLKIWLSSKTQITCQFLIFPVTSARSYHFFLWTLCDCFWIYKVAWVYWKDV